MVFTAKKIKQLHQAATQIANTTTLDGDAFKQQIKMNAGMQAQLSEFQV